MPHKRTDTYRSHMARELHKIAKQNLDDKITKQNYKDNKITIKIVDAHMTGKSKNENTAIQSTDETELAVQSTCR